MTDKIKLLLAYAVVGVLAVLGSLYAPSAELKASCVGIAVAVSALLRSVLQPPPPPSPPTTPPSGLVSMVWFAIAAIGALALISVLTACDFQKRPIVQETEIDLLACVLTADTEDPVALIAKCGPKVAPLIPELLKVKHAAKAHGFHLGASADAGSEQ